jgi:copper(I)-binding protein
MFSARKKTAAVASMIIAMGLLLTGCGSDEASITIDNPVARSIDSASYKSEVSGKYMTGSFMTINNSGDADVTLVGGTSPDAGRIEIHEVIDGAMQPMAGGLVIPADGSVMLRMGGYHVMLMDLNNEIKAGDEVTVTLEFSDGQSVKYTAPVKDIAMDDEVYGVEMSGDMGMND